MAEKPPEIFFYFLSGSKRGKIESSDAQVTRIGRQPFCEVKLDPYKDIPASGEHCHIIRENEGYYLLDSGSTFGTFLNGVRVQGRLKLSTGDVIDLGKDSDGGRDGPRLKFYLETDIRKCPVCSGPVYKRHFKCPECRKKTCLRCIDFERKTCKGCSAKAGFEVVEDEDVEGKKPARVVVSGKEAKKVRAAQDKARRAEDEKPTAAERPTAADDSLSAPFCSICTGFIKGKAFVCPACGSEVCASHQQGKVCAPCAGVSPDPVAKKTRQRPIPHSDELLEQDDLPPTQYGRVDKRSDVSPPTMRFNAPVTRRVPRPGAPVKTGSAACSKCHGPLGAGTFCCRACRRILCYAHVAVDDCCEDCYLARKDGPAKGERPNGGSRPPGHETARVEAIPTISEIEQIDMMPLLDTERDEDRNLDDDLARPPPGIAADGFTGLSFVCPHCDAPLDAAARACPRCRKVL